jgi:hypothetical protein
MLKRSAFSLIFVVFVTLIPNNSNQPQITHAASTILPANKFVGILYENWFNAYDHNYVYPNIQPTTGSPMWWGQPALGFYSSSDTNVINTHANQLIDAGVDFILVDVSNHNINSPTLWNPVITLLNVYAGRISNSIPTPRVVFLASTQGDELQRLFNAVYYSYNGVLFKYGPKPLLLTYPNDSNNPGCNATIGGSPVSTYFECKKAPGLTGSNINWSFLEVYPQPFYSNAEWPEEMAVSVAQQNFWMDYPGSRGRRWNYRTGANNGYEGQNFDDQWARAQSSNPTFVILKSWNEWVAIRTPEGHFTDAYSPEFSTDIEPVSGLFTNLYLQKMKQQIQQFKRNSPSLYFYDSIAGKWYLKEGRGWQQFGNVNFTHIFAWPNGNNYQPIVGDFNDDGKIDIGVRRTDNGVWYFAFSDGQGNYFNTRNFTWAGDSAGLASFQPIVGDFNGDGKTDIGLRRRDTGVWYFAFSDGQGNYFNTRNFTWAGDSAGLASFQPIVGDFNGDGKTDIGLRRRDTGVWYFAFFDGQSSYFNTRNFTWAGDSSSSIAFQPIVGDFDCDGKTDIGLRRTDSGVNYLANFDGNSTYSNYFNNNYTWRSGTQYMAVSKPSQCTKP